MAGLPVNSPSAADQQEPGKKADPTSFLGRFLVLKGAVRELWLVFGIKFLAMLAYGVMNATLVLWLSSDLGFSDTRAGTIVTIWSSAMTLFTICVGSLTDAIGLRRAFLLGIGICFLSRGVMTFAAGPETALGMGLFPLALGEALMGPVMVAAIQRYTTTAQRSISFSIFYALMNGGYLVANLLFDFLRRSLGETGVWAVPAIGSSLSTYRTLFLLSCLLTLPNLALVWFFLREGVEATDNGVVISPKRSAEPVGNIFAALAQSTRKALADSARIFAGLWRQDGFYKFLAFLTFAAFVRLIFFHMFYTYPKFGIRELGKGAPIGRLWAINSIAILILVPIVGALSQRITAYRMVITGSFITASSVFIMACPPDWFRGLADGPLGWLVGHFYLGLQGPVHPYYVMIFVYVLLLSAGESIYSPRLYEYAAAIAPKGQEASYMALSYLPFFVAKLLVGVFSGFLLAKYCPETGPRHSEMLWLMIALTTMIAPVGLLILRPFIQVREAGRDG
jgi:MFS family permease